MSFALISEMLARYDTVRLGELVVDDGTTKTAAQLAADAVLQAHLDDAAALISSAARVGERYSDDDLTDLTSTDRLLLVRLNCDLAYGLLLRRRGYPADQIQNLAPGFVEAQALLQQLREGERVFNVSAVADAGSAVRVDDWPGNTRGVFALTDEAERYFGDLSLPATPRSRRRPT